MGRFTAAKGRWAWVLLQLAPGVLAGQAPGISQLFPPQPAGYLTDAAGIVDPASAARIVDLATRLRAATGAELAVVTLPTIGDYAPADVALQIGRAWGVGAQGAIGDPRRNAGMVLLLVPRREGQRGQTYLATGRGIEGIVTDAMAGSILDRMLPELRDQQYGPALVTGVSVLASVVARGFGVSDSALTAAVPPTPQGGVPVIAIPPVVLFLVILVVIMILRALIWSKMSGRRRMVYWGGPWGGGGGGWGGHLGGGGGGFGGFGGGGGFSGGGSGRSF